MLKPGGGGEEFIDEESECITKSNIVQDAAKSYALHIDIYILQDLTTIMDKWYA